jgi:putative endonuclease
MNWFTYIMTDRERRSLHAGYCNDIDNTIEFYNCMPSLNPDYRQNILVYMEQGEYEKQVQDRVKELISFNRKQKEDLVNSINPDWIELVPGMNAHF